MILIPKKAITERCPLCWQPYGLENVMLDKNENKLTKSRKNIYLRVWVVIKLFSLGAEHLWDKYSGGEPA